ncbi:MAG: hypothetical protein M0C28_41575 [Candidatus Moduliflexus flocculans]|nr:hypothetical protein [Candidatus Moduliflexus flocculans]
MAVNDATSLRIDEIARTLGAEVFRAETGEANVGEPGPDPARATDTSSASWERVRTAATSPIPPRSGIP